MIKVMEFTQNDIVVTEDNQYWIIDTNKWQKSICTKDEAIEFSKTLVNCTNCTNCPNCMNCGDCTNCANCINCGSCHSCRYCRNCSDCTNCTNCIDCGDCHSCSYCSDCSDSCSCSDCTNCINSRFCSDCTNCTNCINSRFCRDFKTNPERTTSPIIGSRNSQTTFYWNAEKEQVVCGCFIGCNVSVTHSSEDLEMLQKKYPNGTAYKISELRYIVLDSTNTLDIRITLDGSIVPTVKIK